MSGDIYEDGDDIKFIRVGGSDPITDKMKNKDETGRKWFGRYLYLLNPPWQSEILCITSCLKDILEKEIGRDFEEHQIIIGIPDFPFGGLVSVGVKGWVYDG